MRVKIPLLSARSSSCRVPISSPDRCFKIRLIRRSSRCGHGDRPIFRNVANRPPGRNDSIFGIVVDGIQLNHLVLDPGVRSYGVVPPVGLPLGEPG